MFVFITPQTKNTQTVEIVNVILISPKISGAIAKLVKVEDIMMLESWESPRMRYIYRELHATIRELSFAMQSVLLETTVTLYVSGHQKLMILVACLVDSPFSRKTSFAGDNSLQMVPSSPLTAWHMYRF